KLKGSSFVLDLPTDFPRPPVQTFHGERFQFKLPVDLTRRIKALIKQEGVTANIFMLAAYKLLLYRYTKQKDIIVGITYSTRNQLETESVIGYFLTMLPLRTQMDDLISFRTLLERVQETSYGAYRNRDLPFGTLLDELDVIRDPSRNPLYQVSFIYIDFHDDPVRLPGLETEYFLLDNYTAKDDLMLGIIDDPETEENFFGLFEYNRDLFSKATIQRMFTHFQSLLESIVQQPDQSLRSFSILSDREREQLLTEWNDTRMPLPLEQTIHSLIEKQVTLTPEAIALRFEEESLSYAALNERANQLAHYLTAKGVDKPIGICMERSLDLVVGIVGIMKAGAAYVPIDPTYPSERIQYMMDDSEMEFLLTQSGLASTLSFGRREIILMDQSVEWNHFPKINPEADVDGRNLAYLIYTSGSTGRPKGVEIEHRSVVAFLAAMRQVTGIDASSILTAVTSISFDIAALEFFLPLTGGGQVVVASASVAADGFQLADCLRRTGTTVMQATPATWEMLLEAGWKNEERIQVLTGGDVLNQSLADKLTATGAKVWNLYGPTEATIWSTVSRVTPGEPVNIGRPIANTEA
ncbi:non-ribosomal peptide synthetase, partial [Fischerella thermalis CCMEE 5273]